MNRVCFFVFILFIMASSFVFFPSHLQADSVDHSIYGILLTQYVSRGVVDYQGLKNDETRLDQYLQVLKSINTQTLSLKERFAFYINAYNAWTIKIILKAYPGIKSIRELGRFNRGLWKKKWVHLNEGTITLDDIEHGILRPEFKDPRVHFAVNCASRGCPPLHSSPYLGDHLNQQLDEVTRNFINDPQKNRLDDKTLFVSKIFKWFGEDFNHDIVGFFLKYSNDDLKAELLKIKSQVKIKYLDYDWSLNGY